MKAGLARAAAVDWVTREARTVPGYRGAYFIGSTVGLPDDAELPVASDVDVVVVTAQPRPKLGKFRHRGALVEITYLSWDELASAERILGSYHLAGGFRVDTIIDDPTGRLRDLHTGISRRFADPVHVSRRCDSVRQRIENGLDSIDSSAPWHEQVMAWLFATGVTTHLILVAALRNPTVRLRYLAAREVLTEHDLADFYPELLELLGCARLTSQRVEHHLAELTRTFDAAASVARTPFFFSTDITAAARPIAIDGSRELIQSGRHREAVFWMVATFARCHTILAADAPPEVHRTLVHSFDAMVSDLGVTCAEDLASRADEVRAFLPRLGNFAVKIRLEMVKGG